nr:phenylalanine--tRNA ligase subunit beta [Desulfobacterales bacterium]
MKVSLSWLEDYVSIELGVNRLADALTMAGLEVDSVKERYEYLDTVVVGRIVDIADHPNADRLSVCKVDVGGRMLSIVCGAPNICKNVLVPVALPGTRLPGGNTVRADIIRGELSEGMICSEEELGIGEDSRGILILSGSHRLGTKLSHALDLSDTVIEFDLTPNRPDCLSIIGVAREIAAIQKTRLKRPKVRLSEAKESIQGFTSVTIEDPVLCPRYAARILTDVHVTPSPFWLKDRLLSVGLRPINNLVDVTNFVLMETGQPLHAFDLDRLIENRIVVRRAQDGERFVTLDGVERILDSETLMICDGKRSVALAGIMGGLNSEIVAGTTRVLIESAYFNPSGIRKTAKRLGLSTEASYRFERGVDPEGVIFALNRAAQLMRQVGGGTVIHGLIDEYPRPVTKKIIYLDVKQTNRLLGTQLDRDEIADLLKAIELDVTVIDEERIRVVPPSFRVDLERPVDLIEEVARIWGYNRIPTTHPINLARGKRLNKRLRVRERLRELMVGCGFREVITYSFISADSCDQLSLSPEDSRRRLVHIRNPLTEDQRVMRTSLIPGLLYAVSRNIKQGNTDLRFFELGNTFFYTRSDQLPEEIEMICGIWTGNRYDKSWCYKDIQADFYDIKGVVENLCQGMNIPGVHFSSLTGNHFPYFRHGYAAEISCGSSRVGALGEISHDVLKNFALKDPVFAFDINLEILLDCIPDEKKAKRLSRFPGVNRDTSLILDKDIEAQAIISFIDGLHEELLEKLYIFDMYPLADDKKSLGFRITYRSFERSLTDEEVNRIHKRIVQKVVDHFHAELPRG